MSINKRSIIQINNTKDVMCMARAVVMAKCNVDKEDSESWKKNWNHMRRSDKSMQTIVSSNNFRPLPTGSLTTVI